MAAIGDMSDRAKRPAPPLGHIRTGVGGGVFAPWRGLFSPAGLPYTQERGFASRKLGSIEINATFYRTQPCRVSAAGPRRRPQDSVFSVKAHRLATHRKTLAGSGPAIRHFLDSGLAELGCRRGPIVWRFAPIKRTASVTPSSSISRAVTVARSASPIPEPEDLEAVGVKAEGGGDAASRAPRDVFIYVIAGAKRRNPAALALAERIAAAEAAHRSSMRTGA